MNDNSVSLKGSKNVGWWNRILPGPGPVRPMMLAVFINTFGSGLFLPLSALYFTTIVGLSVAEVALALGVASVAGMFSGLPLGRLADRLGAREVQVGLIVGMGLTQACYLFVDNFGLLLVFATFSRILDRGVSAVGGALVAGATKGDGRTQARAYLRVVLNLGMALGASLAVVPLQIGTPGAFHTVIIIDACSYLLTAALYLRLPRIPPNPVRPDKQWGSLRDRRFVLLTLFFSALAVNNAILTIGLPLWISTYLNVPSGFIAAVFVVNTVGVVVLMVPISNRVVDIRRASIVVRLSGLAIVGACVLFSLAQSGPIWVSACFLMLGAISHLVGEVLSTSSQFYLSFELADEEAQGEYQGLMTTGSALGSAVGPSAVALLPLALGTWGWLILGAVLMVASLGASRVAQMPSPLVKAEEAP